MFTLKNPNLLLLLAESVKGIGLKDTSPLAKISDTNTLDVNDLPALLNKFSQDEMHEAFMGEMESVMTTVLRAQIKFIRNDVTNTIESVLNNVEAGLEQNIPVPNRTQIITAYIPRLITSEYLVSSVAKFKETNVINVNVKDGAFPELSAQELLEIANYVDDEDVKSMVNELVDCSTISIVDIYNKWFRNVVTPNYPKSFDYVRPCYMQFTYIEVVIAYLLAQGFYANTHANVNLPLVEYNATLSSLVASTGKRISNYDKLLNNSLTSKLLLTVDTYSTNGVRKLVVRKDPYDKLLAVEGIKPDTIIGFDMLGSLDKLRSDEEVSDSAITAANRAAERENSYMQSIIKGQRTQTAIKLVMREVSKLAGENPTLVNEGTDVVVKRCKEVAENYGSFPIGEVYFFIRQVVCLGLFPNSGALKYLKAMDRFQKENPNIQPREAATLATIAAQVDWCLGQLK